MATMSSGPTPVPERRRRLAFGSALVLVVALVVGSAPPVGAQGGTSVVAQGADLAVSASCLQGDIDITYQATDAVRTTMAFTDEQGQLLDSYDTDAFDPNYSGVEHILSDADPPGPPAGSVVAVYVTVGGPDLDAATTAEFFVAYQCSADPDDPSQPSTVVMTCFGPYGECPRTAQEEPLLPVTPVTPAEPISPPHTDPLGPVLTPRFTG